MMLRRLWALLAVVLLACHPKAPEGDLGATPTYRVYFSPKGGCEAQEAAFIASAKTKVRMLAYSFTSKPIVNALIAQWAPDGGKPIDVGVILDESDTKEPSVLPALLAAGVPTWIDSAHVIAHNKVTLKDDNAVETGSFNYTNQAEHGNAENCLFIRNTALAAQYNANWELHKSHSRVAGP